MNSIVIYESKTGFTKQYAEWISEALGCKCISLKQVKTNDLDSFDKVIFGGWIMGGQIVGLNKVRKIKKPDVVFGVGATPAFEEVIEKIKEINNLKSTQFFYMEGGFHFDKLGFFSRTMLKAIKKSLSKNNNKNRQELFMEKTLGSSFDNSDKEQISTLIKYLS